VKYFEEFMQLILVENQNTQNVTEVSQKFQDPLRLGK